MTATRKPLLLAAILALTGCGKLADDWFCGDPRCEWTDDEWTRLASLANPGPPDPDLSNAYWFRQDAKDLGKAFYFDTGFSGGATQLDGIGLPSPPARQPVLAADGVSPGPAIQVSCATCHDSIRGGADTTSVPGHVSVGAGWTDVNALTNTNSAYRHLLFWNGRVDSLWALNIVVAESPTTMNGNRLALAHRIFDKYRTDFDNVFGGEFGPLPAAIGSDLVRFPLSGKPKSPKIGAADGVWEAGTTDRTTVNRILANWAKAIAAYEYELISVDAPFDHFVREGRASTLISGAAKRGARLFVGKAACIDCHNGPHLTDEDFHNIGVPQTGLAVPTPPLCPLNADDSQCDCVDGPRCAPWGAKEGLWRLQNDARLQTWLRAGTFSDNQMDESRKKYLDRPVTDSLQGAWRTPSLRNVAVTPPYMHDGALATLQDVVWHYNMGGREATGERVGIPAVQLKPIGLSEEEMADLVAFLETLTGAPPPAKWTTPPPPR